jgi:uncharacterized protein YeaO (DUF488 family)
MVIIKTKRVYEPASKSDGYRILVDRLWPRGISHKRARLNAWMKGIGPSNKLRKWFHENPEKRWTGFSKKYSHELRNNPYMKLLKKLVKNKYKVTLVYSSRSLNNNATILAKRLKRAL